jgi:RNA polymerase sigma-70 factor (ECF subfamily)
MSMTEIQAIEQFVPHLRRFARALLNDAEEADRLVRDCLDDAMLRCHRHEPQGNLRVWLFALLHQHCRCYRLRGNECDDVRGTLDFREGKRRVVDRGSVSAFTVRDFENAFRQLSAEDQQILLLIGLEGMSLQETAEVLGLPLGTLTLRLWQIRKRLRGIELRTQGLETATVRSWPRSRIPKHFEGASLAETNSRDGTVIRLARH